MSDTQPEMFQDEMTLTGYRETVANYQYFDGNTQDAKDEVRYGKQLREVFAIMSDRQWHTLSELAQKVGAGETSVSARIRDISKPQWYGIPHERRKVSDSNFYEYKLINNQTRDK